MSNFVRNFKRFQEQKKKGSLVVENKTEEIVNDAKTEDHVNESVVSRDSKYIVNGIVIPHSLVNSYISNVKSKTGTDLSQMYSKENIAEDLVRYIIDQNSDGKQIPPSALLGGEEEMDTQIDDVEVEEGDVDVDDDGFDEVPEEGSEDFDEVPEEGVEESPEEGEDLLNDLDDEFEPVDGGSEEEEELGGEDLDLPDGDEGGVLTQDELDRASEDEDEDRFINKEDGEEEEDDEEEDKDRL